MAETFLYLTTTGRMTGNPHTIEIWYVEYEGCYYLCAEHREKSDWVRNIQKTPAVQFYVAERHANVSPQEGRGRLIIDEATIEVVAPLFESKYKWSDGLFVQICDDSLD